MNNHLKNLNIVYFEIPMCITALEHVKEPMTNSKAK